MRALVTGMGGELGTRVAQLLEERESGALRRDEVRPPRAVIDRLHPGRLNDNHVLCSLVELRDPFAHA